MKQSYFLSTKTRHWNFFSKTNWRTKKLQSKIPATQTQNMLQQWEQCSGSLYSLTQTHTRLHIHTSLNSHSHVSEFRLFSVLESVLFNVYVRSGGEYKEPQSLCSSTWTTASLCSSTRTTASRPCSCVSLYSNFVNACQGRSRHFIGVPKNTSSGITFDSSTKNKYSNRSHCKV